MAIPAQPTGLFVSQGNNQAYLAWNIVPGATSYSVERSSDGVTYTVIATPVVNNFLDTTVSINTQYWYQVAAVNVSGVSIYTSPVSVIPTLTGYLSLGELRYRSQQAADMQNSQFLTTEEWNFNINQSALEFYDLLITAYEDYFIAPRLLFLTDGTTFQYPLPNGQNYSAAPALYKLYGVDLGLDNSNNAWVTIKKFNFIQRNSYVYPQLNSSFLGVFNLQYRMLGGSIEFIPTPSGNQNIGLWYFPRFKTMLADTDVLDGFSGWTEYVIIDAAIKALRKEESDSSLLNAQKQMLKERIEEAAQNRDSGSPDTISNTRTYASGYGGWNGDGGFGAGI